MSANACSVMSRLGVVLSFMLALSCAQRSPTVVEAPKAALPNHVSPPAAVQHAPADFAPPQGSCPDGFLCTGDKRCVPLSWHCAPVFYNGGVHDGCDCNCGAPDPDCDNPQAIKWCYKLGQSTAVPSCQACE